MFYNWDAEERHRYESLIDEQMRIGCMVMCVLAMLLIPTFGILDYFSQLQYLRTLWSMRMVTITTYAGILLYMYFNYNRFSPKIISHVMACLASVMISIMCNVTGGYVAPYYAGIMLVMITVVAVFPLTPLKMGEMMGIQILVYCFISNNGIEFSELQKQALLNNMFMICATGFIGIIASWSLQKNRLVSFDRYLQLEKAKKEVLSSREMLQFELASEQNNVEMLVKEITQRKAELERALDLRKEFISLASHELNTPLTSLKLITQMVQSKLRKNEEPDSGAIKKLLRTYDEQIIRLTRIVTDMLDISRIDNGKLTLEKNELDLEVLIKEVVEFTSTGYSAPIVFHSHGSLIGHWDRVRIEQVMLNLVTNALKYGNGKPVEVMLNKVDENAEITVRDQGIGIPSEYQSRIFERFERAVTSYQFAGLGVGLYITKQIVLGHNGQIFVKSNPGLGSEFRVTLPINASDTKEFSEREKCLF